MRPTRLWTGPEVMPKDPQVRARAAPKGSSRTWNHVTVGVMPAAKGEPGEVISKFLFAFKPPTAPLLHTRCSQPQSTFVHLCALGFPCFCKMTGPAFHLPPVQPMALLWLHDKRKKREGALGREL